MDGSVSLVRLALPTYVRANGGARHAQTLRLLLRRVLPPVERRPVVMPSRLRWLLARVMQTHRLLPPIMVPAAHAHCVLLDGSHGCEVVLQGRVRRRVVLLSN